jgi:hypothetical protein
MADANAGKAGWIREAMANQEGPLLRYALSLVGDVDTARDRLVRVLLAPAGIGARSGWRGAATRRASGAPADEIGGGELWTCNP